MKFTRRFAGSYYAFLSTGEQVTIQSMGQFTGEYDVDLDGNTWVATFEHDFDGDRQLRATTKAQLVKWIEKFYK